MKKGRHTSGQRLSDDYPKTNAEMMQWLRWIIYKDIRRMFKQLSPDGQTVIDEMRRDISVRAEASWRLLNEDDQATVRRFVAAARASNDKWVWVIQRQPPETYTNPLPWYEREVGP